EAVGPGPGPFLAKDAVAPRGDRPVVGVDPERAGGVDEEVLDPGVRQFGGVIRIEGDESESVEAEEAVLGGDPQVALRGLRQGGDEAARKAALGVPDVDE